MVCSLKPLGVGFPWGWVGLYAGRKSLLIILYFSPALFLPTQWLVRNHPNKLAGWKSAGWKSEEGVAYKEKGRRWVRRNPSTLK